MEIKIQNIAFAFMALAIIILFQSWNTADTKVDYLTVQLSECGTNLAKSNTSLINLTNENGRLNKLNDANSRKIQSLINSNSQDIQEIKLMIIGKGTK